MSKKESGVIPVYFHFGLRQQDERKYIPNPVLFSFQKKQMGFRQ
jgi:hypothetical protein